MEQRIAVAAERPSPEVDAAPELDAVAWSAEHALKAVVEYQIESLRFLARRAHANLEFFRHLRHCQQWQDVSDLQQAWLKECIADCGEEAGRLAGTSLQLATSDLTPLQWLLYRKAGRGKGGNGRAG
jgi:hypothetical protein